MRKNTKRDEVTQPLLSGNQNQIHLFDVVTEKELRSRESLSVDVHEAKRASGFGERRHQEGLSSVEAQNR
jgi:hypothetical protein